MSREAGRGKPSRPPDPFPTLPGIQYPRVYDIKQFKPTLYLVLLLGLSGFAMAAESPLLWLFSISALVLNAWLVRTDRFAPLPRWLANAATILALLHVGYQILQQQGPPLMFIGQFLVLLQLIKLYEQRANRDYAQLLILSLLLMVAASINTASLLFGVLLIIYLVIALYCCLLFHLKIEADRAKSSMAIPQDKVSPLTLRQDQRFLHRSMRRLTGLVSAFSVTAAVVTFLFFPRGAGQGVLGQLQFKPATALTGFQDRVDFDQINKIKQNEEVVAHVQVWRNGRLVEGTESLFLRGLTLDTYAADQRGNSTRPQWTRSRSRYDEREFPETFAPGDLTPAGDQYRQRVLLKPTGSKFLFALPGLMHYDSKDGRFLALHPERQITTRYFAADDSVQTEPIILPLEYEVYSTNAPRRPDDMAPALRQILAGIPPSNRAVLDQVREHVFTLGLIEDVPADPEQRKNFRVPPDQVEEVSRRFEHHLRTQFSYTLDLTNSRPLFKGSDPVVAFLTKVKKGHCEYFASGMTLMCQSVGIPARMVVGFRVGGDGYNPIGSYYIVRQAHAHTWVEVNAQRGWVTFDPTSGREDVATRAATLWQSLRHFVDYLEYKWAENVVAFDGRDRDSIMHDLDSAMTNTAYTGSNWWNKLKTSEFAQAPGFWQTSLRILSMVVALMCLAIVILVFWFMWQQRKLRKAAQRIGLDRLPLDEQLRLARQLAFYDHLTRTLSHHDIHRQPHQTPQEFAESLVYLPAEAYDTVRRLTGMLYRVRYGQATLNAHRQKRLHTVVARLGETLHPAPAN